jgi:hypothetical protein
MSKDERFSDTECAYLQLCADAGKIGDHCFAVNDSCEAVLKRIELCKDTEDPLRDNPSPQATLNRLDLIENEVKRIQLCVESILTILSSKV